MKLSDLVDEFVGQRLASGLLLSPDTVLQAAVDATRFYAGFASMEDTGAADLQDRDISDSEWALIRPLFILYVERETSVVSELSRASGLETLTRTAAEVEGDIRQMEADMPLKAFVQPYTSVGIAAA